MKISFKSMLIHLRVRQKWRIGLLEGDRASRNMNSWRLIPILKIFGVNLSICFSLLQHIAVLINSFPKFSGPTHWLEVSSRKISLRLLLSSSLSLEAKIILKLARNLIELLIVNWFDGIRTIPVDILDQFIFQDEQFIFKCL